MTKEKVQARHFSEKENGLETSRMGSQTETGYGTDQTKILLKEFGKTDISSVSWHKIREIENLNWAMR
jgi:hypothetical protein